MDEDTLKIIIETLKNLESLASLASRPCWANSDARALNEKIDTQIQELERRAG